jgi:hypothetical protein
MSRDQQSDAPVHRVGMRREDEVGVAELAFGFFEPALQQIEIPDLRKRPRQPFEVLTARGLRGHPHQAHGSIQIALQLAGVRHTSVCAGIRTVRHHLVERVEGFFISSEFEQRVPRDGVVPGVGWPELLSGPRFRQRFCEPMLREIHDAEHTARHVVGW